MYNKRSLSKDTKASKAPKSISKPRDIIVDPMGQWKHPGQNTRIPGNDITMKGVNYPVLGVGSDGQKQMMYPGQDYKFPGAEYVDEYPQMRKGGGLKSKKYSRDLEATNQVFHESPLFKKKKSKKKKIYNPKAKYYQDGGAPIPEVYNNALQNFQRPQVEDGPYPGYNALTNTITQDPNSPIENVNTDWWNQHELFHQLQNDAGGMSTYGMVGQRPNPYAASDDSIHGYYNRRDSDVQNQIDKMIAANPSLQFIPREQLIQNIYPEGSEEPSFVGADSLMYADPSTLEGEARAYENYIRQGGKPMLQTGGVPYNYNPFVSTEPEVPEQPQQFTPIRTENDPEDYDQFLNYSQTAPENRRPAEGYTYGNPNDYDHYGMWDALGKPTDFNQALEMNPDWTPDPYDGSYHGFSVNPNTGVFLKSGKPGFKPGDTTWMEVAGHYMSPRADMDTPVYDPEMGRFKYVPNENYIETELTPEEIQQYRDGGYVVEELPDTDKFQKGGTKSKSESKPDLGKQVYTYEDRPEAKYKKDSKGNWHIMLPSTHGKYVPIKDPDKKRSGELNEKAKPVKPPQWQQDKKKYGKDKVEWYESYNPNDWFLNDYSKYSSYNSAFRNARESGEKEFLYKGERYNTKLVDKKHSDRYWDSKKFVEEYYKDQPLAPTDMEDLKDDYIKQKHGTSWYDYYTKVAEKSPIYGDYTKLDDPRYKEIEDSLSMLDRTHLSDKDPEFLKYVDKNKYKRQLNALNKPTYFSITDYKPSDMAEDGYWDAMKNKMFMTTKADPGQLNTTFVHELSHKADSYDVYDKVPKHNLKDWENSTWAEGWDQSKYDYVSDPSEVEARKLSTLYWFKEHGWPYKPGTIRQEGLDRLYDAKLNDKIPYDIDQLLDLYGSQGDDLLRYLNSDYTENRELGGSIGDEVDLTPEQEAHLRSLGYKLERL
jgi:hypothetical protein